MDRIAYLAKPAWINVATQAATCAPRPHTASLLALPRRPGSRLRPFFNLSVQSSRSPKFIADMPGHQRVPIHLPAGPQVHLRALRMQQHAWRIRVSGGWEPAPAGGGRCAGAGRGGMREPVPVDGACAACKFPLQICSPPAGASLTSQTSVPRTTAAAGTATTKSRDRRTPSRPARTTCRPTRQAGAGCRGRGRGEPKGQRGRPGASCFAVQPMH